MSDYKQQLEQVRAQVEAVVKNYRDAGHKVNGSEFEYIVLEELKKAGIDEDHIKHSPRKFPDFIIDEENQLIGLEVKKVEDDTWNIMGGSVYESLRNQIEETYVLAGKFGGEPEARLRKYEECISDLAVTHSPRFQLKMDQPVGEDYLTVYGATDLLGMSKGDELDRRIRELLRTNKSTWYSSEVAQSYAKLSKEDKLKYFIDGIALFPEVIGGDYTNFGPWLVYRCMIWSSNIRDIFSAGGGKEYGDYIYSAVMTRTLKHIDSIIARVDAMTVEEIHKYWKLDNVDPDLNARREQWIQLIRQHLKVSDRMIDRNRSHNAAVFDGLGKEDGIEAVRSAFVSDLCKAMTNISA